MIVFYQSHLFWILSGITMRLPIGRVFWTEVPINGIGIQVRILGLAAIGTVCSLIACAGGGPGPAAVLPAQPVTPTLALKVEVPDTNALDTVALTVDVTGTANTSVTWSVDGIPNGNPTVGTISGSGTSVTYIAPVASGTYTVTVTSRPERGQIEAQVDTQLIVEHYSR